MSSCLRLGSNFPSYPFICFPLIKIHYYPLFASPGVNKLFPFGSFDKTIVIMHLLSEVKVWNVFLKHLVHLSFIGFLKLVHNFIWCSCQLFTSPLPLLSLIICYVLQIFIRWKSNPSYTSRRRPWEMCIVWWIKALWNAANASIIIFSTRNCGGLPKTVTGELELDDTYSIYLFTGKSTVLLCLNIKACEFV